MQENYKLNEALLTWVLEDVKDMIISSVQDNPNNFTTLIAVSKMIDSLNKKVSDTEISKLIGEEVANEIFEELKSNV